MTPDFDLHTAACLTVAALAGLAVGIEREWSGHSSGRKTRFAGARTFMLLGLVGGVAGWLSGEGMEGLAIVLLSAAAGLSVAAYVMAARPGRETIEGTTEAAALTVIALGTIAGLGYLRVPSAAAAVMVLALGEKTTIQRFIQRIGRSEMRAALRFAVLALVILPLLPEGPYGPLGGIRPRSLWGLVLVFSGLNFAGYLARRAVGEARGYGVTGMLGGLISSTALTLNFSRRSRTEPDMAAALAAGTLGACTVLLPRIGLVTTVLNPSIALALVPFLLPPFLLGIGLVALSYRRAAAESGSRPADELRSPLGLGSAVLMTVAFQVVLFLVDFVRLRWGSPGILTSSVLLGLTDMDALTMSMSRLSGGPETTQLAARSIAIGVLSNTIMKDGLATVLGNPAYRVRAGLGLLLLAAASALGLWLAWD